MNNNFMFQANIPTMMLSFRPTFQAGYQQPAEIYQFDPAQKLAEIEKEIVGEGKSYLWIATLLFLEYLLESIGVIIGLAAISYSDDPSYDGAFQIFLGVFLAVTVLGIMSQSMAYYVCKRQSEDMNKYYNWMLVLLIILDLAALLTTIGGGLVFLFVLLIPFGTKLYLIKKVKVYGQLLEDRERIKRMASDLRNNETRNTETRNMDNSTMSFGAIN